MNIEKLKEQLEEMGLMNDMYDETESFDVDWSNRMGKGLLSLLTPQADGVSRDALYIGAEIRWAGMTPLERAEAIELGWHPSNYLKEDIKMNIEKKIEGILYSDSGVPEMWAGSEESIPKDKRIGKLSQLLQESNEEAVREFVERYLERVRTQTFVHKDMPNFMKQYLKEIKE